MEQKVNIPPFVKGDDVVFIGESSFGLINNKVYQVHASHQNECGCLAIDIGDIKHYKTHKTMECVVCGKDSCGGFIFTETFMSGYWVGHNELRKVQTQHATLMSFEKIKESETKKESQEQEILILN